jgi:hypothetical protein
MYGSSLSLSLFPIDSHLSALPALISACPWLLAPLCMLAMVPRLYFICSNCCLWMLVHAFVGYLRAGHVSCWHLATSWFL